MIVRFRKIAAANLGRSRLVPPPGSSSVFTMRWHELYTHRAAHAVSSARPYVFFPPRQLSETRRAHSKCSRKISRRPFATVYLAGTAGTSRVGRVSRRKNREEDNVSVRRNQRRQFDRQKRRRSTRDNSR